MRVSPDDHGLFRVSPRGHEVLRLRRDVLVSVAIDKKRRDGLPRRFCRGLVQSSLCDRTVVCGHHPCLLFRNIGSKLLVELVLLNVEIVITVCQGYWRSERWAKRVSRKFV